MKKERKGEREMRSEFKETNEYEKRKMESEKIRMKYPDRVPCVIEHMGDSIEKIEKKKFLVPREFTVSQMQYIIRKKIRINEEKAIFIFVGGILPRASITMGELYSIYGDEDGFLYVIYTSENTFGHI